ncbi:MAG: hypothetical protein B6D56_07475 [Candidatus Omnitrophica bacterium 4484_70.1]|nr:MAG: hypothetical protein B6D56_07475 [Candidatus Omnitrophica bacterium 4484_70.1]
MQRLTKNQLEVIIGFLKEGRPLPENIDFLLGGRQETELIYTGKKEIMDVLTETVAVPLQKVKVFGKVTDDKWHKKDDSNSLNRKEEEEL